MATKVTSRETLIVVRLPKTAGTSLTYIINQRYQEKECLLLDGSIEALQNFWRMPDEERSRLRVVQGHIPFGLHRAFRHRCRYTTILRDPVDRVVSLYYYIRATPQHYMHGQLTRENLSIPDMISIMGEMDNYQVRALVGDPACVYWLRPGGVTRAMLDDAMANLVDRVEVVGLAERFDESLQMMAGAFGWTGCAAVRLNRTQSRPALEELTQDVRDAIRSANSLDAELYALGVRLFDQRLARQALRVGPNQIEAKPTARLAVPAAAAGG